VLAAHFQRDHGFGFQPNVSSLQHYIRGITRTEVPLPFFAAQAIEIDDDDYEAAGDDTLPERVYVQQIGAIVNSRQNERTEQRTMDRADRTKKARTTDDG
jgi:hypothetical protein